MRIKNKCFIQIDLLCSVTQQGTNNFFDFFSSFICNAERYDKDFSDIFLLLNNSKNMQINFSDIF